MNTIKRSCYSILIFLIFLSVPLFSQENMPIKCTIKKPEAIVIQGNLLKKFIDYPIENIRLYRYDAEKWEAIPFQIDERDSRGLLVLTQGSNPTVDDESKDIFDINDEIVLMSNDLGDKAAETQLLEGHLIFEEIELEDHLTGDKGWVYCYLFKHPEATSSKDYIDFQTEEDVLNINTHYYSISFHSGKIYYTKLALKNNENNEEVDILDRTKFRSSVRLKWWLFYFLALKSFSKNEDNVEMNIKAYKDGPVRLILRGKPKVKLIMSWELPSEELDSIYYNNQIKVTSLISSPINIGSYCMSASFMAGFDFNSNAKGMRFYNNNNLIPTIIDGMMDNQEQHLDLGHQNWMVLTGTQGTIINRVVLGPTLNMLRNRLYYLDNATAEDSPEGEIGQYPQIGYLYSILPIKAGKHQIFTYLYFPSHFEVGQEKMYFDILDQPLKISVKDN
jgi:hypothetical protein